MLLHNGAVLKRRKPLCIAESEAGVRVKRTCGGCSSLQGHHTRSGEALTSSPRRVPKDAAAGVSPTCSDTAKCTEQSFMARHEGSDALDVDFTAALLYFERKQFSSR